MRRLNVLPSPLIGSPLPWWEEDPILRWGVRGCGVLILIFVLLFISGQVRVFIYEGIYNHQKSTEQRVKLELYQQREKVSLIQTGLENLEKEQTLLDQKLRFLLKHKQGSTSWANFLIQLHEVLGDKITLTQIDGESRHANVEGESPDPQTINTLIANMNQKERFGNVRLNFTEAVKQEDKHAYRFQVATDIR